MASISNIFIDQGATFTTTVTVTDSNGDAVNLSGYSVAAQIRKTFLSSSATAFTASISNASSGEITLESPEAKQARIQKQMSGMLGAETGGANVDSAPATFGFEGASLNMQPSAADVRQARMDDAALATAEGQATITEAEAGSAVEMVAAKLAAQKVGNQLSNEQLKQIKAENPLKLDILKSEKGSAAARAIIDAAKAGNAKATAQLEFAILELKVEAQDISNRTGLQNLAQDKEKFGYTMDLLGLQIEAQDLANQMKTIDADNYEYVANLTISLKELEKMFLNFRSHGVCGVYSIKGTQADE